MDQRPRFHLAFPVDDLDAARAFYGELLGCAVGREAPTWIDFDFGGHQITAHLVTGRATRADEPAAGSPATNAVDGDAVPVRHFGLILTPPAWRALADRLRAAGVAFLVEPRVRFAGQPGEQHTLFVRDPSGNALELKAFEDDAAVFRR